MVLLDATVINIALPRAQIALHFTAVNRQWVITAYALAFGSLLLLGGRVSDLWGRRRSLIVGLAGFALASAFGGAADSFATLVSARVVQGAFGALLAPASLAAMSVTFREPRERAQAFAIYGVIGGSGAAIGLLLGGALTQWASWRWCLYVNVVFAALAIVGALVFVDGGRREGGTRLDVTGTVLASGGLFFVVYGLSRADETSWLDVTTLGALALGVALLACFVVWQRHSRHPLVPLRVVAQRTRLGSLVAIGATSMGLFAVFLLLAYYLEETLGYSPLRTGVALMPLVVAVSLSASFASARLLARTGPRPLVPTGMILAAMGMVLFTRVTPYGDYFGHVLPGLVVTGLGLGLIFAPAAASATAAVTLRDTGAASAMVNTAQQIGGSFGTALLNTVAVTVSARVLANTRLARASAGSLPSANDAIVHGYSVAFWWAGAIFVVGSLFALALMESGPVNSGGAAEQSALT